MQNRTRAYRSVSDTSVGYCLPAARRHPDGAGLRCAATVHGLGGLGPATDTDECTEAETPDNEVSTEVELHEEDEPHSGHRREDNPASSDDVDGYCF